MAELDEKMPIIRWRECYYCATHKMCLRIWQIENDGDMIYICKNCILEYFEKGKKDKKDSEYLSDEELQSKS